MKKNKIHMEIISKTETHGNPGYVVSHAQIYNLLPGHTSPPCSLSIPNAKSPLLWPISFISSFFKQRKFLVIFCRLGLSSSSMDQIQETWFPAHITFRLARSSTVSMGGSYLQSKRFTQVMYLNFKLFYAY
jgi:hypothetical protein